MQFRHPVRKNIKIIRLGKKDNMKDKILYHNSRGGIYEEFQIEPADEGTCRTQAELYEYIYEQGYDIVDFSDKYLNSDFCNREMDSLYSVFQREDPVQILDFVIPQIGDLKKKKEEAFSNPYIGAWELGYIYRYLHFLIKVSSKDIAAKINTKTMIHEMNRRMDWNIEDTAEIIADEIFG